MPDVDGFCRKRADRTPAPKLCFLNLRGRDHCRTVSRQTPLRRVVDVGAASQLACARATANLRDFSIRARARARVVRAVRDADSASRIALRAVRGAACDACTMRHDASIL